MSFVFRHVSNKLPQLFLSVSRNVCKNMNYLQVDMTITNRENTTLLYLLDFISATSLYHHNLQLTTSFQALHLPS
jgi:hypothetical protein